jgi:MoaA/NifB/PqqE/SkfB family radical SAM enzyme
MSIAFIPAEFNIINTGRGFTMKGWDFNSADIAGALENDLMLNPAFELGSNFCPWDCFFCFTEDPSNPEGLKKKLKGEMSLDERLKLIEAAARLGAKSINFVGAGEPTVDPHFWEIVGKIAELGMTPIIYTEGALKLTDRKFAEKLYSLGATVVLKVNSLWNEDYQNAVVNSGERRSKPLKLNYFQERNKAMALLTEIGFNKHDPTRLAFDTILCKENIEEVPRLHRFARDNNIFILLVNYLPSGRSSSVVQNALTKDQQFAVFEKLAKIDDEEYGLPHRSIFPYAGGVPCSIRGLGLYVKIKGDAWDCPGESERLGNIREESLQSLWEKAAPVRRRFNGGCEPRELFWKQHERRARKSLPILR